MDGGPARLVEHVREQARHCGAMGSPLYAAVLARVADDLATGGPAAAVLAAQAQRPGPDAVALRLAQGVHRVVLSGRAPDLARHYPSAGGSVGDPGAAWPAFRAVLVQHRSELVAGMARTPQTNEIGRAAALWPAVLLAAAEHPGLPLRLLELGASAGLLLRADHVRLGGGGVARGPSASPVVLDPAWDAAPPWWPLLPERVEVTARTGVDLHPLDATTPDGRLSLLSAVWPDQLDRITRLRGALELAAAVPVALRRGSAADALDDLALTPGAITVVQHSFVRQYLGEADRARAGARLDALGAAATASAPLAHVSLEPRRTAGSSERLPLVQLRSWPGGGGAVRTLGRAGGHGPPVRWSPAQEGGVRPPT